MYRIETQLTVDGKSTMHQGTSGITLTGTRTGDDMNTLIEYSPISSTEIREMVCCLLCMMEDLIDEWFVASCFTRYAEETGKHFYDEGNGRRLVMIRGKQDR